ncbi:uncharacterized protein BYT42DRAFT_584465 [Radiomyces spectabilis]|uniref:uncharacterized protein n=1 Tax=Radiomyces spectabilis TaxID=64574 RepID=UPI00221FCB40|nr:uncharacterized protein BYT42DRAFT_584465 [Radiomyces spectabilis]KAI8369431.1 hypothetical protein BYT42DRAFT_584465 [Radiomyces spectabilis]
MCHRSFIRVFLILFGSHFFIRSSEIRQHRVHVFMLSSRQKISLPSKIIYLYLDPVIDIICISIPCRFSHVIIYYYYYHFFFHDPVCCLLSILFFSQHCFRYRTLFLSLTIPSFPYYTYPIFYAWSKNTFISACSRKIKYIFAM